MITADEGKSVVNEAFRWIEKNLESSNVPFPELQITGIMIGVKAMVFAMAGLTDNYDICVINREVNRLHDELLAKFRQ